MILADRIPSKASNKEDRMQANYFFDLPEELQFHIYYMCAKEFQKLVKLIPRSFYIKRKEVNYLAHYIILSNYNDDRLQHDLGVDVFKAATVMLSKPMFRWKYDGPQLELTKLDNEGDLRKFPCPLLDLLFIDSYNCKKQLQQSCDENGIKWYKSWTKKQLKKALMSV